MSIQTAYEFKQFKRKSLLFYVCLVFCTITSISSCVTMASMVSPLPSTKIVNQGNIQVTSEPPGASVLLDGQLIGKTPLQVSLSETFTSNSSDDHELNQLLERKKKTIVVRKQGYVNQEFSPQPDNITEKPNRSVRRWGLVELIAGVVSVYVLPGESSVPALLITSGLVDAFASTKQMIVTRQFEKNIHAMLITEADDARKKQEYAERIAKENTEREIRIAKEKQEWEANAPTRAEAARKEQAAKEQLAKMQEAARVLEQAKKEAAEQRRRLEFAKLKEGDRICAQEANCGDSDACLKVGAFIEKWSSDRTKYQIRIHTVNSGSVTRLDASGVVYSEVDGIRYNKGEIIWINPFERPNTIWVSCHLK
jgi:PEGA domain